MKSGILAKVSSKSPWTGSTLSMWSSPLKYKRDKHDSDSISITELQGLTVPSPRTTEAGIPRDRAQQACSNCAVQKLKCSGEHDGCLRCAQNELACQYPISKRRSRKVTRLYQTVPRPSQKRDQSLRSAAASQDGSSLTGHLAQPSQSRE
jgi:hypothetical protein